MPPTAPDSATLLENAKGQGALANIKVFLRLSGPGWLQSALTLGGGTLAGSLFLGVVGGYSMLWVQALALAMGVVMLAAISYVSLSIKETAFHGMRTRINPVLAWGWIIATLAANMVWSLPQFSLAYGAITENIAPGLITNTQALAWKLGISFILLAVVIRMTLFYGSSGVGIKIYETLLKLIVAIIVLCFMGVTAQLAFSETGLPFGQIAAGFIPQPQLFFQPSEVFQNALDAIANDQARAYWTDLVLSNQRNVIIGAASAAVGINMTFLLPFSMRAKGWGKSHRGLAIFDLSTGMVIPFVLATACVVIVSGHLFHGKPFEGILVEREGIVALTEDPRLARQTNEIKKQLAARSTDELAAAPVEAAELRLAAMLLNRSNQHFAKSLETLVGPTMAHFVFGIGVLAMALSSISILMLISGFVVCEMFGFKHGGREHKLGTLLASTGVLWPFLWSGTSQAYLAIPTSVFGYTLLPVAFLAFLLMMNSKSLLGAERPKGRSRVIWNSLMGISLAVTGTAAISTAWTKTLPIAGSSFPIGKVFLIGFGLAIVAGHFYLKSRKSQQA